MNNYLSGSFWAGVVLFAALLLPAGAGAQINNCGGVWTNQPCTGEKRATLGEAPPREQGVVEKDMDAKQLWFHDLEMQALKARRSAGIEVDMSLARGVCLREGSSLEDCTQAVNQVRSQLIDKLAEGRKPARKVKRSEPTNSQQNNTVVVVNNNGSYCDPLRDGSCAVYRGGGYPGRAGAGRPHAPPAPPPARVPAAPRAPTRPVSAGISVGR
jgi:hypothetical protein